MPAVTLSAAPKLEFFTSTGLPLVGGQLFTYLAGTSTPAATYTDSTGTIANANPIVLDSRGEANVWLVQNQAYKYTLQDSVGNLIYTVDNVNYAGPSGISQTFANGSAAVPSVNFTQAPTSGLYSPGVNQVAMSSNGVQAMLWDASQNVGIGGTPTTKLDVFGGVRIQGAAQITTGGLTVTAGGVIVTAGGLSISSGGFNVTGGATVNGAFNVIGGVFTTRGFADNAATLQWNIDSTGRLLNNGNLQPSFNAFRSTTSQTSGTTFIFNTSAHNYGGSYAIGSGVFTAPVAGIYHFAASVELSNGTGSLVSGVITINCSSSGNVAAQSFSYAAGLTFSVSLSTAAIQLAAGETVTVQTSTALTTTFTLTTAAFARFSGRLLG